MATIRWLSWLLMICATCRQVMGVEVDLSQPLDLVFLVDSSESITGSNFNKILQFMAEVVEDASVDSGEVRVAVVTFGDTTVIRFGLDEVSNKEELLEFVQETTFDTGNTYIADALLAVRTKVFNTDGDRPEARNVLLVITDGVFDLESSRAMREAETSKQQGIDIYAIGIGLFDVRQLDRLVSKPLESHRFLIENFGYLQEAKSFVFIDEGDAFLDPFGELDGFDPDDFDDFGTFEGCGNRPMDIVLLVDTSDAYEINNETYLTIRDFLIKFVKFANVSSEATRISLVTYSTSPTVHFRLGEISTAQGVQDAIQSARFSPGERNLADALDALRRRVFFEYYGDRPQVPDIVILITTGRSNRRVTQSFQYAQALKDIGVNVIGITWSEGGKQELSSVVSEPAYANLFSLDSISELHIMTELVVAQVCESSDDVDLVFLVHFSNQLTSANFAKITSFMIELIEGADVDLDSVRVGAAIYRAEGTVLFKLDAFRGDKSGLIEAIRSIKPSYRSADTNLAAGLNLVRTEMFDVNKGDREAVPNGLVIITDANSDSQYYPELEYAAALVKDAGVTVFGIGIDLRNTDEMNMVATSPQMSYVLGNVDHLPSMVQELRQKLPSLTFVLPEDIDTLPPTTEATPAPTTERTTPEPSTSLESSREADIAVLFHVGHKVKLRDLNKKLKIYLSNLFAKAKVSPDMLRVALVNYGTATNVLFGFNAHSRKPQVRSAIKTTIKGNLRKSRANLGEALSKIRTELFVPGAGSRIGQGVPAGLIIVTDMVSSNDGFDIEQETALLKQMGVTVFGVGIGSSDVHDELRQLSSDPASDYFQAFQTFGDLLADAAPVKNIVSRVRAMGGKLKRQPTTTAPALSTTVPQMSLSVSEEADIIIAVHSSITATPSHFTILLEFLAELYEQADIDGGRVKAGVLFYGSAATPIFYLDQFNSWDDVFVTISRTSNALRSNVVDASQAMKRASDMFAAARGGPIPKALIMVTDAASNENTNMIPARKEALTNEGVSIYSVGIGLPGKEELELLATASENVFSVIGYEQLPRAALDIKRAIRSLQTMPERVTVLPVPSTPNPSTPVPTMSPTSESGPIRITFPAPGGGGCGLARVDMVFVIDSSTSVGEDNFLKQINFVKQLLSNSDIDSGAVRAGVLIYSTGVEVQFQLNDYNTKAAMFEAIDNIQYIYGSTNTADGLRTMRQEMFTTANGDRPDVMNIAIVITDGVSNINSRRTIPEALSAHEDGIFVYTVGIGLTDTTELDAIATPPASSNSFVVDSFDELEGFSQKVLKSLCPEERTLPTRRPTSTAKPTTPIPTTPKPTTPKPTTPPPTHAPTRAPTTTGTQLPTERPSYLSTTTRPPRRPTVESRESTIPPRITPRPTTPRPTTPKPTTPKPTTTPRPRTPRPTTPRPTRPAKAFDLVVVMDSSVRPEVFSKMTDYVKMVTGELSIDNEKFRMGLLRFSTYPDIQFQLGNYKTQKSVQRAIDRVQYRPGETNTAKAFDIVRTQMFKRRNGDRSFARNFILYLTGNDESENKFQSFAAAERAEDDGIQIFTVGFGLQDTSELNEISSHPLSDFQQLFLEEEGPKNFNDVLAVLEAMPDRPPKARRRPRPPATTPRPRPEGPCTSTGDVVFILDTSGSVGRDNFYRMLNFTWSTVNELEVNGGNYRIGLMTFSDRANREFNLNSYDTKEEIKKAISRTAYIYGRTNTADAFLMARRDMFVQQFGDRPDVPNVIVIITDGESNINNMRTIPEAMTLKRAGVTIITVAVGYADSSAELFGITSNPVRDNLIRVENFDALELLKDKLITPLCTDINLCLENPCHNGAFCIDGLRSYMCVCTEGYYGDNCQNTCGQSADVVFMLDSSTSIGQSTFQRMKTYAEELVRKMNIESCDIQVGVMKYSSASMVQFNIGAFRDTETIVRAIDAIHYTRGQANMASAFETVRKNMFNSGSDRPNVRNIAYLLTDGSVEVNADTTMQEAELAINSGIRIVPIGIDLRVKTDVETIANVQGVNTIEINGADGLRNGLADQVLRPVFEDESYCDANPCSNGGQCRENGNGFVCDCVPGYTGDTCERRCDATADVVFVVDTSRYVSRKELRSVKRFLRSIIKRMQFKRHRFRAGIVSFAKYSRVKLTLGKTSKKKSILSMVSGLRSKGAYDPNPAEALRKANLRVLTKSRTSVPRYVVFVTKSMRDENNVIKQANKIKMKGVKVLGIGIDLSSSDQEYLKSAVSMPHSKFMHLTDSVEGLTDISDDFMSFLCNENDPCSDNPCQHRGECVSAHGEYYCKCPRGYAGKNCDISCPAKADIAFVLDASGSVGAQNFRRVKHFVTKVIDELAIGYDVARVGAVSYSSRSYMGFYMDQYNTKEDISNAIAALGYEYGNTNTAAGLRTARTRILTEKRGDRANVRNFVVVVTDSISNVNQEKTLPEAQKLKDAGAHVFSVGIGSFDPYELRAMASEPADSNTFVFNDFVSLANFSQTFVRATCVEESVLCNVNRCKNGGVCVPGINSFSCKCPRGFNGPTCEMECISKKDVVFVLDSSSSVGKDNYQTMLDFVKALVEELAGASFNNRFGMIVYSTEVRLIFSLGRYKDAATIGNSVGGTRYYPGSTNTAGGLRTALEILTNAYGARRDAEDVVILITDGQSNVNSHDTIPAAEELKSTGARVLTIGVGLTDYSEVAQIASTPEDVFKVSSYNLLHDIKTDILDSSCNNNGYSGK